MFDFSVWHVWLHLLNLSRYVFASGIKSDGYKFWVIFPTFIPLDVIISYSTGFEAIAGNEAQNFTSYFWISWFQFLLELWHKVIFFLLFFAIQFLSFPLSLSHNKIFFALVIFITIDSYFLYYCFFNQF